MSTWPNTEDLSWVTQTPPQQQKEVRTEVPQWGQVLSVPHVASVMESVTVRWSMTIKAFVPSNYQMKISNNTLLRWHTWHITMTHSWDSTHGILQWHPPEMAHVAYYNNTLLRWHTWHITMTPSWDGTHGILQWHPPEMAHMAYYNNTLLRGHTVIVICHVCHLRKVTL
jgi:hypothetical protein